MGKREELLEQVSHLAVRGLVTKDEVIAAFDAGYQNKGVPRDEALTRRLGISEILYCIGGAIVVLGISILIWQNWSTLSTTTKILATLGSGVAAYIVGVLFCREEKLDGVGQAFHLIAALVIPLGLNISFDQAGYDIGVAGVQSVIAAILLVTYLASYFVFRKAIFTFFTVGYGTWLFFAFTSFLVGSTPQFSQEKFYEYRILLTGLTYILLGYSFSQGEKKELSAPLYGFGVLGFLGAALALGGWSPNQNIFWEITFPGWVFGVIFLSIYLRSKAFLTFGSLYLMAYILKITAEYFTKGLGWPFALVLAGLCLITIGYFSVYLNKKYISA